jgi:cytochrome c oxidase subunit II
MAAAKIIVFEKAFLTTGLVLLVVCLVVLLYTSVVMGITLPGRAGTVDPAMLDQTAPFDAPGVRQVGPDRYEVVVIGYAWGYAPREIRVPVGAEISFISTSRDVLHGFHVEGTRLNMMLIPGQISRNTYTFREPGEHLLICHEFCGVAHHAMYGRVIALAPEDYEAALAAADDEADEMPLHERGELVFTQQGCQACHSVDGSRGVGPSLYGNWGQPRPQTDGSRPVMDEDYVVESIREPSARITEGYPAVMPPYPALPERDLAALLAYIRYINGEQPVAD